MRRGAPEPFYDLRRALALDLDHDPPALPATPRDGADLVPVPVLDCNPLREHVEALALLHGVARPGQERQRLAPFERFRGRCVPVESNHDASSPKPLSALTFSPVCWGT
jgi:hypothetical protein